jgi:hypothetical protein
MTAHEADFTAGYYDEAFTRFDGLGEDTVSLQLAAGDIDAKDREAALIWLGNKMRLAAASREAMARNDREIAISAKDAAWEQARQLRRTNTRATIALAIAALSAIIAIISVVVTCMART